MSDTWDDMRRIKEEEFFEKQNREALTRLKSRSAEGQKRLSPVSGEPMEELTIMGVVVDRCPKSGGVWLDAGELEQILAAAAKPESKNFAESFLARLRGKK